MGLLKGKKRACYGAKMDDGGDVSSANDGPIEEGPEYDAFKKAMGMADGGKVAKNQSSVHEIGVHKTPFPYDQPGMSGAGYMLERGQPDKAKEDHKVALEALKSMKKPNLLAQGGMADCPDCCDGMPCEMHGEQDDSHDMDMLRQVMEKRRMSKGGMIANSDKPIADFMPNEFDDLHLRDELTYSNTGANAGDDKGDADNDRRLNDMVAQAMMKRRKQRNPNPA